MDKRIVSLIEDVVNEIDYDIYKENYSLDLCEDEEMKDEVESNILHLFNIIKRSLRDSFSGDELIELIGG